MKRDDFGMRIDNVRELATKYSKPELARMVQMGMVSPQEALMAGMMIDRIAKSAMQPPQTTVAQDVLAAAPTGAQAGIMGAPNAPPPSAGVAALPSGLQNMAGGGIVAFADGGDIPRFASRGLVAGTPEDMVRANDAANAALGTLSQDDYTLPGGLQFRQYNVPQPTNVKTEMGKEREALQEAGVDTEMYKRMREEEAGRREELKGRREEAKGEALLMAGLGLMGARKGQEFQALSDVGRQAVMQYSGALREIRDTEKDIKKAERELMFAEDRAKRDMSTKSLARVDAKQKQIDEMEIRQTDLFNKAVEERTKLNMEIYKIDRKEASDMAIAQLHADTSLKVAEKHIAASRGPGAEERIINNILADLRKTNPNATYSEAVQAYRSSGKSNMLELQEKYADDWLKMDYLEKKKFKDQGITDEASYIAYRTRLAQQMPRGQTGGASVQQGAAGSGFSEGQEAKDTSGRPIVYKNGQWVYK